jgi:hypothetical protein
MLRRANRRDINTKAAVNQDTLRAPQLRQPHAVQAAYAAIVSSQRGPAHQHPEHRDRAAG